MIFLEREEKIERRIPKIFYVYVLMNKPKIPPYGNKLCFLLISVYNMQCFNYAAVSTNRVSQHFS